VEAIKKLCMFVFELGHQRRVKHNGWRLALIERPDSVAEHSLRAAQIAYILAYMEGYPNPSQAAAALVFHDCHETRISDLDKVARRYINVDEEHVARDQLSSLGAIGQGILDLWLLVENKTPPLGPILKDADLLECAFTGKEYLEIGYQEAQGWIDYGGSSLNTESAKKLHAMLCRCTSTEWWHSLKKL
jgi:putative hydrolase of HD superfamily